MSPKKTRPARGPAAPGRTEQEAITVVAEALHQIAQGLDGADTVDTARDLYEYVKLIRKNRQRGFEGVWDVLGERFGGVGQVLFLILNGAQYEEILTHDENDDEDDISLSDLERQELITF